MMGKKLIQAGRHIRIYPISHFGRGMNEREKESACKYIEEEIVEPENTSYQVMSAFDESYYVCEFCEWDLRWDNSYDNGRMACCQKATDEENEKYGKRYVGKEKV